MVKRYPCFAQPIAVYGKKLADAKHVLKNITIIWDLPFL